nr:MAG TPA: hypothetical protein [Caudoviricetes sp.]
MVKSVCNFVTLAFKLLIKNALQLNAPLTPSSTVANGFFDFTFPREGII